MFNFNNQLISDRKLFQHLHKHVQPYQQLSASLNNQQIKIIQYINIMMDMMNKMEKDVNMRIIVLMDRLEDISKCVWRLNDGYNKYDGNNNRYGYGGNNNSNSSGRKLYSFANSPEGKSSIYEHESDKKQRYMHSTQHKTKQKQAYPSPYRQSYTSIKSNRHYKQQNYLQKQINFLSQQIHILKQYINQTHPNTKIISIQQLTKQHSYQSPKNYLPKQQQQIDPFDIYHHSQYADQPQKNQHEQLNRQLSRNRIIIGQYKKQQEILQNRISKYRSKLQYLLKQLQYIRDVQLPGYLPCQACQIKNIVYCYLFGKDKQDNTANVNHDHNHNHKHREFHKIKKRQAQTQVQLKRQNHNSNAHVQDYDDLLMQQYEEQI